MARLARGDLFDPGEVSVFHCINRCVRRCFLCGTDPLTGQDYRHRKQWLEQRLAFLAGLFGIDVLGFAIMSNHFHLILRNRPDAVAAWDDAEVARRWLSLCPPRKTADGTPAPPTDRQVANLVNNPRRMAELRTRLSDISWLMRMVAEPLARRANAEEQTSGRFWQGRFRSVKLCDEAAILACSVYVDLNPIRAGLAATPEESDFTSAQRRIQAAESRQPATVNAMVNRSRDVRPADAQPADAWLAPLPLLPLTVTSAPAGPLSSASVSASGARCSDKGFLPLSLAQYLELLDWTGRQVVRGKRGAIPPQLAPILNRLAIGEAAWMKLAVGFGRLFQRVAGRPSALSAQRTRRGRAFRAGSAALLAGD